MKSTQNLVAFLIVLALLIMSSTSHAIKSTASLGISEGIAVSFPSGKAISWKFSTALTLTEKLKLNSFIGLGLTVGLVVPNASDPIPSVRVGTSLGFDLPKQLTLGLAANYQFNPLGLVHSLIFSASLCAHVAGPLSLVIGPSVSTTTTGTPSISLSFGPSFRL